MADSDPKGLGKRAWFLLCALLAVPVVVGVATVSEAFDRRDTELRELTRFVVRAELQRMHWRELETDTEFHAVIDVLSSEFGSLNAHRSWKFRLISLNDPSQARPDEIEQQAMGRIRAGATEVWTTSRDEGTRYVAPIVVREACIACHPVVSRTDSTPRKPGDIMAFASVRSQPRDNP